MANINKLDNHTPYWWSVKPSQYILTTVRPPDWTDNYAKYYTKSGGNYVAVTSYVAWAANTFYFGTAYEYPIFTPSSELKYQKTNLTGSDTGWTEAGENVIDWIRRDITKVNIAYKVMTESELAYMRDLLQGKEYKFRFNDIGVNKQISCYTGEMSYTEMSYDIAGRWLEPVYKDCSMNVIETFHEV